MPKIVLVRMNAILRHKYFHHWHPMPSHYHQRSTIDIRFKKTILKMLYYNYFPTSYCIINTFSILCIFINMLKYKGALRIRVDIWHFIQTLSIDLYCKILMYICSVGLLTSQYLVDILRQVFRTFDQILSLLYMLLWV